MNDKLVTIAHNCVALRDKCTDNHFVATVLGDGTETLTVAIPFAPDAVWVFCTDPVLRAQDDLVAFFNADLGSLGYLCAVSQCSNGVTYFGMVMTNTSVFNRYSQAQDGTVTIHNVSAKNGFGKFGEGLAYHIIAVKYIDKTDKERFTELVERLTGSGRLQVWADKVHAAFTDEEWTALTATKPDWTFEEV